MIVPAYPGRVVLRFKYNQMCFFLLEIFEVENSHGIFLGFVIGPIRSPLSLEIRSTPPPPARILVPSTDCDVISFNGQGV